SHETREEVSPHVARLRLVQCTSRVIAKWSGGAIAAVRVLAQQREFGRRYGAGYAPSRTVAVVRLCGRGNLDHRPWRVWRGLYRSRQNPSGADAIPESG